MLKRHTSSSVIAAASTAALLGLAAFGTAGCRGDRTSADARRALGTQLGSAPPSARVLGNRQAATADDLVAARRYLEATLRLDPTNAAARAGKVTVDTRANVAVARP